MRLTENLGSAFNGCCVLGMGFVLEPEEAALWIEVDPRNSEVLFPYLNGEDLNSRPDTSSSRWVIDFDDRTEKQAAAYRLPMSRLRAKVYPERQKVKRKARREQWWQYAERQPGMRRAIANLDEVVIIAQTSATQIPLIVSSQQVFDQKTVVFSSGSPQILTCISSSQHRLWATCWGSTRTGDPVYTPSKVAFTYPFPPANNKLDLVGRKLNTERREMMLRRDLGLTKLYNLVNDPDVADADDPEVARLRAIHAELDHAVMDAYGWSDVPLEHGFHTYRQMQRWTVSPAARVEILDRLLEENHRRAAAQGSAPPPIDSDDGLEDLEVEA